MNEEHKNVKTAVDSILGVNSMVRRKRKTKEDKNRELFYQLINRLEECSIRTHIAFHDLRLDMSSYDESYLEVIDSLMYMLYGKQGCDLIAFYLYERIDQETGNNNPIIIQETGEEVFLESPYELYDMLKKINPKMWE